MRARVVAQLFYKIKCYILFLYIVKKVSEAVTSRTNSMSIKCFSIKHGTYVK